MSVYKRHRSVCSTVSAYHTAALGEELCILTDMTTIAKDGNVKTLSRRTTEPLYNFIEIIMCRPMRTPEKGVLREFLIIHCAHSVSYQMVVIQARRSGAW